MTIKSTSIRQLALRTAATSAVILAAAGARAANQTATVSPIQIGSALPYQVTIEPYDFGQTLLPTVHSYAAGHANGKWVVLAGRTNGLHGFTAVAANNFPPATQNREVWVIDPVTKQSWSRSLTEAAAGLTTDELNSLTQTNSQFYQRRQSALHDRRLRRGKRRRTVRPFNNTFDELSAIDLPGLAAWAMGGDGTAKAHIRQISRPALQGHRRGHVRNQRSHAPGVRPGLSRGTTRNASNGAYTRQVRSFDIVDDGANLSIANVTSTTPDDRLSPPRPEHRARHYAAAPADSLNQGLRGALGRVHADERRVDRASGDRRRRRSDDGRPERRQHLQARLQRLPLGEDRLVLRNRRGDARTAVRRHQPADLRHDQRAR